MSSQGPGEVLTVADDEVIVWHGAEARRFTDLRADHLVELDDGLEVHTLPAHGEPLARIATANDVHFGEIEAGRMSPNDPWPTFSVPEGAEPYPEVMNRGAVHDIAAWDPDLVIVKGDLTSAGRPEEYRRFREVWEPAFGERLMHVRGNHESWHRLDEAAWPIQERVLPGVHVALLDTSVDGDKHGSLTGEQLDWLDELGQRADRPVLVFGHHPVWDPAERSREAESFHLLADATEALQAVFLRRRSLRGYFAGHTHRNKVVRHPELPTVPFGELACVKDHPGSWAEYRIFDGLITQVHRRIATPDALAWSETCRGMFAGAYPAYAQGRAEDRCFVVWREEG